MDKLFYIENRRRMAAQIGEDDVMLFFSGEGVRKTADENYPFFTNRNFLYLTGVKQEHSALLIKKTNGDLTGWLKTSQLKDMLKDIPSKPNYQLGEIPATRMYTPGSAGVYSYERIYYTQYNMIFEIGLLNVDNQPNRDFYDQILSTFSHSEAPAGKKGM